MQTLHHLGGIFSSRQRISNSFQNNKPHSIRRTTQSPLLRHCTSTITRNRRMRSLILKYHLQYHLYTPRYSLIAYISTLVPTVGTQFNLPIRCLYHIRVMLHNYYCVSFVHKGIECRKELVYIMEMFFHY